MARTNSDNNVRLRGRLGGDVALREKGENLSASFRVIRDEGRFDENGNWETTNEFWMSCVAFGKIDKRNLVDKCMRLRKGQMVHVEGRLASEDPWTDDKGVIHQPGVALIISDVTLSLDDLESFELIPRKGVQGQQRGAAAGNGS